MAPCLQAKIVQLNVCSWVTEHWPRSVATSTWLTMMCTGCCYSHSTPTDIVIFGVFQNQDTGVRAIVAGLGVASSKVMIASSLNSKSRRHDPDAYHCQKVASGYVSLIVQWREELMRKPPSTVHRLFPLD